MGICKNKGKHMHISVGTDTVWNVLASTVNNKELVIDKLKRHLRYRGYVYFEPVCPSAIYEVLNYLKRKKKFYGDISISYG